MSKTLTLGAKATSFACGETGFSLTQGEVKTAKKVSKLMQSWIQAGGLVVVPDDTPEVKLPDAPVVQEDRLQNATKLEQFDAWFKVDNPSVSRLEDFCRQAGLEVPRFTRKDELVQGIRELLEAQDKDNGEA